MGSKNPVLQQFINALRGNRKPALVVSQFRDRLDSADVDTAIEILFDSPKWRVGLPAPFPRNPRQVHGTGSYVAVTLRRELQWARAYLRQFSSELGYFVAARDRYYRALLNGDFGLARDALSDLQEQLGDSLWLYKNQILLTQLADGLKPQKKLTARLAAESPKNNIVAFIAHYASVRAEPTVLGATYLNRILKEVYNGRISTAFATFLRYHLAPIFQLTPDEARAVLEEESSGAVVDYFTACVDAIAAVVRAGDDLSPLAIKVAATLGAVVPDRRLRYMANLLIEGRAPEYSKLAIDASMRLLSGQRQDAETLARAALAADPLDADSLTLLGYAWSESAQMELPSPAPVLRIAESMADVYRRGNSFSAGLDTLARWANQLSGSGIETHIARTIAMAGHGIDPAYDRLSWRDWALTSAGLFPERLFELSRESERQLYADHLRTVIPLRSVHAVVESMTTGEIAKDLSQLMTPDARIFTEAQFAAQREDHDETIRTAGQLLRAESPVQRHVATRLTGEAYLALRRFPELAPFIVRTALLDSSAIPLLPLGDTVLAMDRADRRSLSATIELPILFELFSRHVGPRFDDMRGALCWAFCRGAGVDRPSQLRDIGDRFGRRELIYFLRFVCTEDVMATSQIFGSTRAVAEERLLLCRILAELDPPNSATYEAETNDVLRRVTLQRRMRAIERSKVYVDTTRIRKNIPDRARQAFDRYQAFLGLGHSLMSEYSIEEAVARLRAETKLPGQLLVLPNEMRQAFETAVQAVRDEYVSSTEYGLDGYLSVNIRHGTFAGQVRAPLEAAHLVTRQLPDSSQYRANDYWLDRLTFRTDRERARVDEWLRGLARDYDALLDEINTKWLRVAKEDGTDGMLDFRLTVSDYRLLASRLEVGTPFDTFVDYVFDALNDKLERALSAIRGRLKQDGEVRSLTILDKTLVSVENLLGDLATTTFAIAVNGAKTEVQRTFDRVADWFRNAKGVTVEPFVIEDAINLCTETIRGYVGDTAIRVIVDAPGRYVFPGVALFSIYYIFINAFENIVKHSRVDPPRATVEIHAVPKGLEVVIANPVADSVASNLAAVVEQKRRDLQLVQGGAFISREGGSGLYKIKALLERDLAAGDSLGMMAVEREFRLSFVIPLTHYETASS